MANKSPNQEQLWKRCPQGVLHRVANRTEKRNTARKGLGGSQQFDRRRMLQIAAAVAVTTGAGTLAYQSLFPRVKSKGYGGISCSDFLSNLQKHIDKSLDDQQLVASMDEHLKLCKPCRARYEKMRNA